MKITICGSIAFIEQMVETRNLLEQNGHQVRIPLTEILNGQGEIISATEYYRIRQSNESEQETWIWERKKMAMKTHFEKIIWSDVILVLNYEKNGIPGYVGSNTLIEMGIALYLDKPIYLLHTVPEIGSREEILGMMPILLNGDLQIL